MDAQNDNGPSRLSRVWTAVAAFAKTAWDKIRLVLDTIVDPPKAAIKWYLAIGFALIVFGGVSYAFVNSWFYKPTVQYFSSFSWSTEDGDVVLPEHKAAAEVVPAAPVYLDASDTPERVKLPELVVEASSIPPPVAKPKLDTKKKNRIYRVKRQPYQTYWGF